MTCHRGVTGFFQCCKITTKIIVIHLSFEIKKKIIMEPGTSAVRHYDLLLVSRKLVLNWPANSESIFSSSRILWAYLLVAWESAGNGQNIGQPPDVSYILKSYDAKIICT